MEILKGEKIKIRTISRSQLLRSCNCKLALEAVGSSATISPCCRKAARTAKHITLRRVVFLCVYAWFLRYWGWSQDKARFRLVSIPTIVWMLSEHMGKTFIEKRFRLTVEIPPRKRSRCREEDQSLLLREVISPSGRFYTCMLAGEHTYACMHTSIIIQTRSCRACTSESAQCSPLVAWHVQTQAST